MRTYENPKLLRPDAKGRICLGHLAKDVSSFHIEVDEDTQEITLTPYTEIPLVEKWLFNNEEALNSVKKGLHETTLNNKLIERGSFKKHLKE